MDHDDRACAFTEGDLRACRETGAVFGFLVGLVVGLAVLVLPLLIQIIGG